MSRRKLKLMDMERVRLVDDVEGRQGTVVDVIYGVETDNPRIDEGAVVKFVPDVDLFRHPWQAAKMLALRTVVETPVYPADAVNRLHVGATKPGQPKEVVHISENAYGEAPYREQTLGQMQDNRIAKLQAENERLRSKLDSAEIDKIELEEAAGYRDDAAGGSSGGQSNAESSLDDDLGDL